jgi:GTP cyclohydrolase I
MGSDFTKDIDKIAADNRRLEGVVRELLEAIGEDPTRDGLTATPRRVAEAWRDFTSGYGVDVDELLSEGAFEERHEGMILVKDIEFYSVCEHHLVPFFGQCHVAYLPDKRFVGLSKTARLVEVFARRLQVQERMTDQIARALERNLKPRGVAVAVEAQHLCMMMRGVEKHGASAFTSAMLGKFRGDASLVAEFYDRIGHASR